MGKVFIYIWRTWFYMVIGIVIILLFPFIFISSQKASWYPVFFRFARIWAWLVLLLSGLWPRAYWHERPHKGQVYIICPNHTSMADIMMTLVLFPNCFLFIGKKELAKMPLFGYFYRKTNLLVDRSNLRSRQRVFTRGAEKLDEGIGLCVYPEGGVPKEEVELAPFKNGAFRLAAEKMIPIIPVTYPDNKRHLPFNFRKGSPGILRAVIHPFIVPRENSAGEVVRMKEECFSKIESSLDSGDKKIWINEPG